MADEFGSQPEFLRRTAGEEFELAFRKGFWRSVLGWFRQSSNQLLPFDEVRRVLPAGNQYDTGLHQIPLEAVIGSVGRYNDFDKAFLPTQRHTRSRWINIDMANLQDINLPPIEVYKVGEIFFVKDGNHRVSVARDKGQMYIDANVIEIETDLEIDKDIHIEELIRRQERSQFYKQSGILELRPEAEIELTLPNTYGKILEHISVHRWYMGEHYQREVNYPEAVAGWYDEVYLPLVKVINEGGILKWFPNRTPTDLYLWIIEHLWYLREELKSEISLQEAASHFANDYSKNPLKKLWLWIRRIGRVMASGAEEASERELGILAEDMMIDNEIQNPDSRSRKAGGSLEEKPREGED